MDEFAKEAEIPRPRVGNDYWTRAGRAFILLSYSMTVSRDPKAGFCLFAGLISAAALVAGPPAHPAPPDQACTMENSDVPSSVFSRREHARDVHEQMIRRIQKEMRSSEGYEFDRFYLGYIKTPIRPQGFKLHVSATDRNAAEIAGIVLPLLREMRVNHKVVRTVNEYVMIATGSQRGKFITIFPDSDRQAAEIAQRIDSLLREYCYDKTDFWAVPNEKPLGTTGAVSTRYGQFTNQYPGLIKPDGSIVPDERGISWKPDWVSDPFE